MDERRERLIDLTVIAGAVLIASFLAGASVGGSDDPQSTANADVRRIEQSGIIHEASMSLPSETRSAIGLDGEPGEPAVAALEDIDSEIVSQIGSVEGRLMWVALAVSWQQDTLARGRIAELASDAETLSTHRVTLDELLRLANGSGVDNVTRLESTFSGFGASRWLTGHLRQRHLANIDDPQSQALSADLSDLAASTVTRWTIVSGLELFLFPAIGLMVLVLMPMFLRRRLLRRRLAFELGPTQFKHERTWRVVCAWFIAFQVAGYLLLIALSAFLSGSHMVAISVALQALAGLILALFFIDLWARQPRDPRTATAALGLKDRSRLKLVLLWLIPGIALAMALVRAADYLNLMIMRRTPELQNVVQMVVDEGSPALLVMIGVGAVLLAPLTEEVVFRGFLFRNLRDSMGKGLAMLFSGLAFALVHFQPTLILPLTALGIALAVLYEWTGTLYVPIAVHAAWNLFALVKIELWRI